MATRALRWIGVFAAVALALSACSNSTSGGGNFPTNQIQPTGEPQQTVGPDVTGSELLQASLQDVTQASSFHIIATSKTKALTTNIDMYYNATGSTGTITLNKSPVKVVRLGADLYVNGPDEFWQTQLPAATYAADISHIHGKWVKVPVGGTTFAQLTALTDKQQVVGQLVRKDTSHEVRGKTTKIGKTTTIELIDQADDSKIYVAESGTPYPVQAIGGKGTSASATFGDWNKTVVVKAPTSKETYVLAAS